MKKKWIFWVIIVLAFVALFLFVKFAPAFTVGAVVGYAGHYAYKKWISKEE